MRWYPACTLPALIALCGGLVSNSSRAESLIEVYELAEAHDAEFRAAVFQHQATQQNLREAWAEYLPVIGASAERIETDQDIKSSDNAVFATGSTDFPVDTYSITLTQPLFRWASIVRIPQARAEVRQSEHEFAAARQDLMVRVSEAYFGVLEDREDLDLARAERDAVAEQLRLARGRMSTDATRIDVADAEARLALAEAGVHSSATALADGEQALVELTGEVGLELSPLAAGARLSPPAQVDEAVWVDAALSDNHRVAARREALEVARREVDRMRAGHYPTLDFVASWNNRDTDGTLFGGGSEVETTDLLVRLNVPIYEGGRVTSRTRRAEAERRRARADLDGERRLTQRETLAALRGTLSSLAQVRALERSVSANEQAVEYRTRLVRSGRATTIAVLDAQRDLFLASRDYSRARYAFVLESVRLKRAAGRLSADDLQGLSQLLE